MKRVSHRSALRNPALLGSIGVRIWSGEHGAWWRPDAAGYTGHIEASGLYTPADALDHTRGLDKSKRISFGVAEDLPIIYSASMVLALIDARKFMTRREAWTYRQCPECKGAGRLNQGPDSCGHCRGEGAFKRPSIWQKVRPGDRLWVRENWRAGRGYDGLRPRELPTPDKTKIAFWYEADMSSQIGRGKLRPAIFMPRWASRITLDVTATRIEPLQKINDADSILEGIIRCDNGRDWYDGRDVTTASSIPRGAFYCLWLKLHGKQAWDANPDVVPISFTVRQGNIDALKVAA